MIKPMLRIVCLGLLSGLLFGCGGEPRVNGQAVLDGDKKGGTACADIFAPVCSVEKQNIQCFTEPCPIGVHKTYPNRCESNAAKATFLAEGECGDLEGEPYFEEPVACTREYAPVCAAVNIIEPCHTLPCPSVVHKTFGNKCEAKVAKAHIIRAGECGEQEGMPVTALEGACPAVADPVCGKDEGNIVCVTEPCPTHQYKTFGNPCEAELALAPVVLEEACGKLEDTAAFAEPPIQIVAELPTTGKTVTVSEARFNGDLLQVTLGYSGCGAQHFALYAQDAFLESIPLQVHTLFKPTVEDLCLAFITTEFVYDLLPLKHAYQKMYQAEHGEIVLRGIGNYVF